MDKKSVSLLRIGILFFLFGCSFHIQAQIIFTIAGNSHMGLIGDGGPATTAELYLPDGIAVDSAGNIFIGEEVKARKVNTEDTIITCAGGGSASGDGIPATAAILQPREVALDNSGNIYICDPGNYRVHKVNGLGIITTIAGNGTPGYSGDGGPATAAAIQSSCIAIDGAGNLYITDSVHLRKINTAGIITTIAGNGTAGDAGDGGPATAAQLNYPNSLTSDAAGNIYMSEWTGSASGNRIRKVSTSGIITTFAGVGTIGYSGDGGPATAAEINYPVGIFIDATGNVYFGDHNATIRKVNPAGIIYTIAGNGIAGPGYTGDGGPAYAAQITFAGGISRYGKNNIYFSDRQNNVIRMIALPKITIASSPGDTICAGTPVIFTASVTNDASIPQYQWQLNSVNTGTDTPAYVTDTLHNGDVVSCILSYTFGDTVTAISNIITMAVDSFPHAGPVTGADTVCTGDTIALVYGAAGGAWRSGNTHAAVSGGMVAGITAGVDTIHYTVTNACGIDSAMHIITVAACPSGVAPPGLSAAAEEVMRVLPNPNDGTFTFSLTSVTTESVRIVVTNVVGEKVKKVITTTNKQTAITLNAPAGVYFLSAATAHGRWSEKIVVVR